MRLFNTALLGVAAILAVSAVGCGDDTVEPTSVPPVETLTASTITSTSVTLSWSYSDDSKADSFRIFRGGNRIGAVPVGTKTYTDNSLSATTQYDYTVRAVKGTTESGTSTIVVTTTQPGQQQNTAVLKGNTGSTNRTLSKDTIYKVEGFYFVQPGTKLIIPAGTKIMGDFDSKGAIITVKASATRPSGQLIANGTAQEPIIFTSSRPEGQRARADWGGIVLNGIADINVPGKTGVGEGATGAYGPGAGAAKNDDTSGILRYVRIEYGGTKVTADNEINGLTLNGCGTGTVIDHVQCHFIADDGFEWFGGTVTGKYLVSSGNDDDAFDFDFGFSGKLQFILALQDPTLANRGFEVDNDAEASNNTPYTSAVVANATVIGAGRANANNENNDGAYLRRNNKIKIYNSIITNFGGYAVAIDGANTKKNAENGELGVYNSVLNGAKGAYAYVFKDGSATVYSPDSLTAIAASWNSMASAVTFGSIDFANPNPVPTGAVAVAPQTLSDSFFQTTAYVGAFGGENWLAGWTNFRAN